jgi:hypothetical protein
VNLLDDTRRLRMARNEAEDCYECGHYGDIDDPHAADCPYLALPRIVAALEAAEALVEAATTGPNPVGGEGPLPFREWRAFVAALRGEVAPPSDHLTGDHS